VADFNNCIVLCDGSRFGLSETAYLAAFFIEAAISASPSNVT
jgi:hypothetical protein